MSSIETITRAEIILWLAGLEKDCPYCVGCRRDHQEDPRGTCACRPCHGTGKVHVLDLRDNIHTVGPNCLPGCKGWVPKHWWAALHEAMHKAGWGITLTWFASGYRHVNFYKEGPRDKYLHSHVIRGADADDWLAAAKAYQQAGYGGLGDLSRLHFVSPESLATGGAQSPG